MSFSRPPLRNVPDSCLKQQGFILSQVQRTQFPNQGVSRARLLLKALGEGGRNLPCFLELLVLLESLRVSWLVDTSLQPLPFLLYASSPHRDTSPT